MINCRPPETCLRAVVTCLLLVLLQIGLMGCGKVRQPGKEVPEEDAVGEPGVFLMPPERPVRSISISQDGKTLAAASGDGTVVLWDMATGRKRASLLADHGTSGLIDLALSPDGGLLASAGMDKVIRLWDVAGKQQRSALGGHGGLVTSVAFSPDGQSLASSSHDFGRDGEVRLWDIPAGKERLTLVKGSPDPFGTVTFSPDSKTLAAVSLSLAGRGGQGEVRLWDVETGKEIASLKHNGSVVGIGFAPDGESLATCAFSLVRGLEVKRWDVRAGKELATALLANTKPGDKFLTLKMAFAPDGKTVAGGGEEEAKATFAKVPLAKAWDVATGQELGTLQINTMSEVRCATFTPDGRALAVGGEAPLFKGEVRLWELAENLRRAK